MNNNKKSNKTNKSKKHNKSKQKTKKQKKVYQQEVPVRDLFLGWLLHAEAEPAVENTEIHSTR